MFSKILIANRGEIAVRIIRACKEMNVATVAIFSEADANALHVQLADEAVCVGAPRPKDSYLNMQNIISAAVKTNVAAIHPGFGFLAENSVFAAMCGDCGIKFIGPSEKAIKLLGDKSNARRTMLGSGVPVIPGSDGLVKSADEARATAAALGYPVIVKATAGGGGRGIRQVYNESDLESAFLAAKNEARANFANDGVYIEKIIENARHIEIQILCDAYGAAVHLGERDCSLQRRNQKALEESPSPVVDAALREKMGAAAITAAKAAGYENAGTIEFLYDEDGNFYFMEMNTRIQVEHPVTEMVTGVDIVKEQLKIAFGEKLEMRQEDVIIDGCAIECRINAENPEKDFAPSPGKIQYLFLPSGCLGLRVDSAVFAGYEIPPYYDSMIAKVITHAKTRADAISKMKRALSEFVIRGVDTNIDFQMGLLNNPDFVSGRFNVNTVKGMM
ncbi:MAG: acetyl-CoA carboxylase biotin carboxylase subunit [Clostridiales bacterium]|nr:acetyl-CoA carboxylase biotin carboxylase subunit [Clostridiales bacterium]